MLKVYVVAGASGYAELPKQDRRFKLLSVVTRLTNAATAGTDRRVILQCDYGKIAAIFALYTRPVPDGMDSPVMWGIGCAHAESDYLAASFPFTTAIPDIVLDEKCVVYVVGENLQAGDQLANVYFTVEELD